MLNEGSVVETCYARCFLLVLAPYAYSVCLSVVSLPLTLQFTFSSTNSASLLGYHRIR